MGNKWGRAVEHSRLAVDYETLWKREHDLIMSCDCGERFQRVFPATTEFGVYFDAEHRTVPLRWNEERMIVCINCGNITSRVPEAELQELRRGAGGDEPAAF